MTSTGHFDERTLELLESGAVEGCLELSEVEERLALEREIAALAEEAA